MLRLLANPYRIYVLHRRWMGSGTRFYVVRRKPRLVRFVDFYAFATRGRDYTLVESYVCFRGVFWPEAASVSGSSVGSVVLRELSSPPPDDRGYEPRPEPSTHLTYGEIHIRIS
jgi:hypothetical protein